MTAVFPRTMWKYQHVRAYRVVLLDAGHLCQTFCLVATWLGLAPFCTAALKDTLIEKRPRNRRNSRVGALCSGSRFSCYFGASEATIFSKRAIATQRVPVRVEFEKTIAEGVRDALHGRDLFDRAIFLTGPSVDLRQINGQSPRRR